MENLKEVSEQVKILRSRGFTWPELESCTGVTRATLVRLHRAKSSQALRDDSLERLRELGARPSTRESREKVRTVVRDLHARRWNYSMIARHLGVTRAAVATWAETEGGPAHPVETLERLRDLVDRP